MAATFDAGTLSCMSSHLQSRAPGRQILDVLARAEAGLGQLQNGSAGKVVERQVLDYCRWATDSARELQTVLAEETVERLVLTKTFYALAQGSNALREPAGRLLSVEIELRRSMLATSIAELKSQLNRWNGDDALVVFDTSAFIHAAKLEEIDWLELLAIDEPLRLLVPMVVLDELDALKESRDRFLRWRAGYSTAVLARCVEGSTLEGWLHAPGTGGQSAEGVRVEIVRDPVGHIRLPIVDDEIVDRALAARHIADRAVHLVTYDTGMEMRARGEGSLRVHKQSQPLGPEPDNR